MSKPSAKTIRECRRLADTWSPVLRGLANPDRLLIVLWLADATSTVRELQEVTGLNQSLVSYHLRTLRDAGLVMSSAVGRANAYRLSHPDLDKLAALVGRLDPAVTSEPD